MTRGYAIYVAMFVALIVGLWVVLSVGSRLRAPDNLSGTWDVTWATRPPTGGHEPDGTMLVQQSGRFVNVTFDGALRLKLKLADGTGIIGDAGSDRPPATLVGDEWTLSFHRIPQSDELALELTGPGRFQGVARRPIDSRIVDSLSAEAAATADQPAAPLSPPTVTDPPPRRPPRRMHGLNVILVLLAQIALILAVSRVMGMLFARFGQPQVMGEMIAGIMLGPSLFGLLMPEASELLFPAGSIRYLNVLSQVGVIFFLFLIGLELDVKLLHNRGHAAVVISHVSIIAPFILGAALALLLYPRVFTNTPEMRFTSVALFMGAAMSITAFPVLARILTERNLHKSPVGAVTITCAAVDDVTAWCMLAFVVAVARATGCSRQC